MAMKSTCGKRSCGRCSTRAQTRNRRRKGGAFCPRRRTELNKGAVDMKKSAVVEKPKVETALWTLYRVRLSFLTNLCASVPADPEVIQKWLEARKARVR